MKGEADLFGKLKRGEGGLLVFAALIFFCASFPIHQSVKFASTAASEKTVPAQHISIRYSSNWSYWKSNGHSFGGWSCKYDFIAVDGASHNGNGVCPQWIVDAAKKGNFNSAQIAAKTSVYYDPNHPSINSLLKFNAASKSGIQDAFWPLGGGTIFVFLFILGRMLDANEKSGNGGAVVDSKGTVIYPEEIGLGSEDSKDRTNGKAASDSLPQLRELYLELVKRIHPDRAANDSDRALRERLMKAANAAFERGDAATLRGILKEYSRAIAAQPGLPVNNGDSA